MPQHAITPDAAAAATCLLCTPPHLPPPASNPCAYCCFTHWLPSLVAASSHKAMPTAAALFNTSTCGSLAAPRHEAMHCSQPGHVLLVLLVPHQVLQVGPQRLIHAALRQVLLRRVGGWVCGWAGGW